MLLCSALLYNAVVYPIVSYGWLGSPVVMALDLRLDGREFDSRPLHYLVVSTGMGDRLRAGMPQPYVTSYTGQLSLLPFVGREMSTGQTAVICTASGD